VVIVKQKSFESSVFAAKSKFVDVFLEMQATIFFLQ